MKLRVHHDSNKGFTLIEILLVVAAIAILAGIVILAINPGKQLADTRNTQRRADVNTILNAVHQFTIDNRGVLPSPISGVDGEICKTAEQNSCNGGYIDLPDLTDNEKYLTAIPVDPSSPAGDGSGYLIRKTDNGRIVVTAPHAEQGVTIEVSR